MKLEKISTETIREKVYKQLRKKITFAEIPPGQLITIRNVAKELGVSLMPVREALWQLESEKIIVIESNKSIHVNSMSGKQMQEALRLRLVLESMAVERACELRPESSLEKVKRILEDMENTIEKPKEFLNINNQFHFTIYSFADSPMLLQIIDLLWARIGPYLFIYATKGGDISYAMECHRGIYKAFVEKDKERMREFLNNDLEASARFVMPFLE